ncbi:uncharacterized protein F4822DRAFT_403279 [Hypoxylon trugodes]|uniref:uncharacterized protein n=1 Tax=Hypoxylon trugodes TaxID=326681 RepID=UPI00219397AC|nr:uncharacterized protein F4822DRAFT_403279 [Hypoxylon trugodes]KAI1388593.1 hypothetical protein F4822DRAFT_403279 [Hypoxylon trugodes]
MPSITMPSNGNTLSVFPFEIWLLIANILEKTDRKSLVQLSLCNKAVRNATVIALFREFRSDCRLSQKAYTRFFQLVAGSPALAKLVQHLDVSDFPFERFERHRDSSTLTPDELEENGVVIKNVAKRLGADELHHPALLRTWQPPTMLEMLPCLLPNLKSICIGYNPSKEVKHFERYVVPWSKRSPDNRLALLKEVRFKQSLDLAAYRLDGVRGLFSGVAPNIDKLRMSLCSRDYPVTDPKVEITKRMIGKLKVLRVYHARSVTSHGAFFDQLTNLETLIYIPYSPTVTTHEDTHIGEDDLVDELNLIIRIPEVNDLIGTGWTLKRLTTLRFLAISQRALILALIPQKDGLANDFLFHFLPKSLEVLHIWEVNRAIMPHLVAFHAHVINGDFPNLKGFRIWGRRKSRSPLTILDWFRIGEISDDISPTAVEVPFPYEEGE